MGPAIAHADDVREAAACAQICCEEICRSSFLRFLHAELFYNPLQALSILQRLEIFIMSLHSHLHIINVGGRVFIRTPHECDFH